MGIFASNLRMKNLTDKYNDDAMKAELKEEEKPKKKVEKKPKKKKK